ncbi:MAG: ACT domain-containing protein, partial [Oscillospiraceae bacterium]
GYGVSIHKKDCANVLSALQDPQQKERWLKADWAKSVKETFQSSIEVIGQNRPSLLADLSVLLNNLHVAVHSFVAKELKDGRLSFQVTMAITDVSQLVFITSQIKRIAGILTVERISG